MKTKIILGMIIACTMLFACKKENNAPNNGNGSSVANTGTLYFKNTQSDSYTIYLDGTNMGILSASSTSSGYSVTTGISHAVKAVQYNGYIFTPTEYTGTATLNPGGSLIWNF